MRKRTTLLIDGENLIKRSFLARTNYYTKEFGDINCLFNFMLSLRTITNLVKPDKIVVFWDGQNGGKLRYNIYRGYKANRKTKDWYGKISLSEEQIKFEDSRDKSLLKQKTRIKQYLEELFVWQVGDIDIIEADDLIAYYCEIFSDEEYITIYSNDRDLCQLIDYDNVSVYLANIKVTVNKHNYFAHFKHDYRNLRLLKTFCGDTSDNIQGVDGLQETTFLKLFPEAKNREMSVDDILLLTEQNKSDRILNKKKSLKVVDNIIDGKNNDGELLGRELYDINFKLVNLKEPFLTKEAKHSIREIKDSYLDDTNRGSKNILRYMEEDGFIGIWKGNISEYFRPFYPTILKEKSLK